MQKNVKLGIKCTELFFLPLKKYLEMNWDDGTNKCSPCERLESHIRNHKVEKLFYCS